MASAILVPALYEAARQGNEAEVDRLLAAGADLNATHEGLVRSTSSKREEERGVTTCRCNNART